MNVINLLRKVTLVASFLLFAALSHAAPVDINTADAATIASNISGVGMKKAQAIVHYRETNGPFKSVQDLVNVKGIGPKTIEKNLQNLSVSSVKANSPDDKQTSKN